MSAFDRFTAHIINFIPFQLRAGRKLSIDCNASFDRPAPEEPDFLPGASGSGFRFQDQSQKQPHDEGWDFWEEDTAMMPWAAGLGSVTETPDVGSSRNPVVFLPEASRDPLNEELHYYMDKMATRGRDTPCYVILFGLGTDQTEGIYTLRTVDSGGDGEWVNVDTVVAFEAEVDGLRFSTLLEASLAHVPSVYATTWGEITDWCADNNTRCRLELAGSFLIPPESNVAVTDWERALSLQRGMYSVLDEEPALGGAPVEAECSPDIPSFFIDGPDWVHYSSDFEDSAADLSNIVDSKLADVSIASIREGLERLLNH